MFVVGVPFKLSCQDSGVLNFLVSVAKYAIYKSRKLKLTKVTGVMSCPFSEGLWQQDFG